MTFCACSIKNVKSMKMLIFIFTLLFLHPLTGETQIENFEEIKTVNFDGLEPYLHLQSDTVYVINFWATWCGPCVKELPDLEKIHRDYSSQKVKVLLVSLDFPLAAEKNLIPFINENGITAQVILLDDPDANSWIDKVNPSWSGALPATLVYNKNDRIFFGSSIDYEMIDSAITDLTQ